jgi:(4S)-4-hydroxy-5-phosphonooxypentane-2,3-dione isomerase
MSDFVILVDFRLKPGAKAAFRRLIDENARTSCRDEPGCRRFDVLETPGEADRIVLYEIYDDRAAFQAHIKTSHFAHFNEESAALVADKRVTEFDLVCEGSAA